MQPILASPLLACEDEFYALDDAQLSLLARGDMMGHFLAQQAGLGDVGVLRGQEGAVEALPGVVNLHLHIMHSVGKGEGIRALASTCLLV